MWQTSPTFVQFGRATLAGPPQPQDVRARSPSPTVVTDAHTGFNFEGA